MVRRFPRELIEFLSIFLELSIAKKETNTTPVVVDNDPLQHDDYFNVRSMVTLEDLFK